MNLPVSSNELYIFHKRDFFIFFWGGTVGRMWLQLITVVMSSFRSGVPASNDLEPAGTIAGPQN